MSERQETDAVLVLGAGLSGASAALELARLGHEVIVIDRTPRPMLAASRFNEGKLHLGYIYAADPKQRTHAILSEGSLQFLNQIEHLTGFPRDSQIVSEGFTYIVPETSTHSAEVLWSHFRRVDATLAEQCARLGLDPLPPSQIVDPHSLHRQYSENVVAAFRTPEIAAEPGRVADTVSAALYAHRGIMFCGNTTVVAAEQRGDGRYGVTIETGDGGMVTLIAPAVVNALWEERVRIDAMVGIASEYTWSQRWKATVLIDVPPGAVTLPSTTALVGPYGDFVLYGDRHIYVSWYPECRLSLSTTTPPEEVRAAVEKVEHDALRRKSLAGLGGLMPDVAGLEAYADTTRIGGGFIMAVGDSDIDDRQSLLHERHQIGVERVGNWASVSTGKWCTAPTFGIKAAEALHESLTE